MKLSRGWSGFEYVTSRLFFPDPACLQLVSRVYAHNPMLIATDMATKGGKRTSNTKATRKLSVNFDDNEYILGSENGEDATLLEDSSDANDR
jgi:hypothetical protein